MAVNDDLQRLFPNWNLGPSQRRRLIWLWLVLGASGFTRTLGPFDGHNVRNKIAAHIKENNLRSTIDLWRNDSLLDDHSFAWIEDNGRQPTWFFNHFLSIENPGDDYPPDLTQKEKLIALIDRQSRPKANKEGLLKQAQAAWVQRQKEDRHLAWYASASAEKIKCEIAWRWYQDHHPRAAQFATPFSKLADILTFHDGTDFSFEEKLHHLGQIKKKFKAQQTAANRKGKQQTNLSLSDDARRKLDALSKKERMTRTELIELLIENAHERGVLG